MVFKFTPISIVIFIATIVNFLVALGSWHRRKTKGGIFFALAAQALTIWTLAAALDYAAVSIPLKVFFAKVEAIGYGSAIPLVTALTIVYAGNEKWFKLAWVNFLMAFFPVSSILLIWTNDYHQLIWSGFRVNEAVDNVLVFEHGPAFPWVTFTGYGFLLVSLFNLVKASSSGTALSRKQARLLLLSLIVPIASNVIYLSNVTHTPGVDWTSITFSVTGVLFLWALYGSRFLDIAPVARNILIEKMSDGVLVLDNMGYLVDFNPAAQLFLKISPGALWTLYPLALKNWPEVVSVLDDPAGTRSQEITVGDPPKVFDLRLTPLEDNRDQVYGRLVVMRDVTRRKQIEENLLQAQKLLVSQQREMAAVEERQHMARNLHDSVNQSIHSVVLFSETLMALLGRGTFEKVPYYTGRLQEAARQALKETRLLLFELQPPVPKGAVDLLRDLETRLGTVERHAGMSIHISLKGSLETCPQECQDELYWIAIEALNNTIKYAQAKTVKIDILGSPDLFEMEISDDGLGFDQASVPVGGFGLHNMRERARLAGGQLTITSAPGQGTSVKFSSTPKD